jgi:CheY-like chemotaxis protein
MYEDYRVLFVDDEPNILNSLRRGLAEEEYFCHFAGSGKEALEIIKSEKIAVIVTDMRMPEMNGLELLTQASELSPMTVKVVLSGYTQLPQILVTVNQVDIFKFITKPWELDDFIMVIRKCLDYYILREQNANYQKTLEAKNTSYQNILKKINELIDDAKFSREILGICGKSMLNFGNDYSPDERAAYQSTLARTGQLFDILTEKATVLTKEMEAADIGVRITGYIKSLCPEAVLEQESGDPARVSVNIKMLEAAVDIIWAVFSDDFQRCGLLCQIKTGAPFAMILLSPNVDAETQAGTTEQRTATDVKIELVRSVLDTALNLCNIKFQIRKLKGSLVIEISLI